MERRLVAILALDVVGYSRLMGQNEVETLTALTKMRRQLLEPLVSDKNGKIIKRMGDGWLVEFPNATCATQCAINIQQGVVDHDPIRLRIGLHLGDVTFQDEDMYGDGINIAARLETLAAPGQVLISDSVYHCLDMTSASSFHGGEEQELKNIARPVQTWHWPPDGVQPSAPSEAETVLEATSDKPSLVVLPFSNFSSDTEQEFFADGIVEDLITAFSKFPWLFVISRSSSFSYKGEKVTANKVREDLGVRYMVEGSVRMSPSRIRVTVQLIDALRDHHIWAENYDRPMGDFFDLQDEICQTITGVLMPALSTAERERYHRESHPTLDAWAAYQKGLVHYYRPYSGEDHAISRRLFDQSIELDSGFGDAHAMIAMMGIYSIASGQTSYTATREEILAEARQAAERAVELDEHNALAHVALGRVYQFMHQYEPAIREGETATKLNPNLAMAHHELGFILVEAGRLEESIPSFDQAIRLSPNDPSRWNFFLLRGIAQMGLSKLDAAFANFEESSRLRPVAFWPFLGIAAVHVMQDDNEAARKAIEEVKSRNPDWTVEKTRETFGLSPKSHYRAWLRAMRSAGLPE